MGIPKDRQRRKLAFSLIEVVMATAVFATAIVAVLGLMGPISRRVTDVIDSETAARLADSIESELARIGFSTAVSLTGGTDSPVAIQLVANTAGDRVRLLSDSPPSADNALDHATVPGVADRDRYFLITLERQFPYSSSASGSLTLRANVVWPYQLPAGPVSSTTVAHGAGADGFVSAASTERQSIPFFFVIRP